ncbi:MAG: sugar ABC transporter substrate-binding protein [Clostridiales bacterium]|nr:sugar ABC transporter substrate-binding protein [Clostridiales bacterium]
MNKKLISLILALVLALLVIPMAGGMAEEDKIVIACAHRNLLGASGANFRAAYYYTADQEGVEIMFKDANGDVEVQANYLEDCIASGTVDAIIVWAADPDGISGTVQQCTDAGIPVITVDIRLTAESRAFVAASNYNLGVMAGESAVEFLTAKYGAPKGTIYGASSEILSSCRDRDAGFLSVIQQYPDIKWDCYYMPTTTIDDGVALADDLIQRFPEGTVDVYYGGLISPVLGLISAAQTYNRTDFAVVGGFDYNDTFVEELSKGKGNSVLYSFTAQDCFAIGSAAMQAAIKCAKGEELEATELLIDGDLVTVDNLQEYLAKYNRAQEIIASYQ